MDVKEQEEVKFRLGFFGILKESFKIIWSWRKIFTQITLALIIPLSFIFLAGIFFSQIVYVMITQDEGTENNTHKYKKLTSSESTPFWLVLVASFILLGIFALISTFAVVYTIACKYTAKEISFKKAMSVPLKVLKRLVVTFVWSFFLVLVYNLVAVVVIVLCVAFIGLSVVGIVILLVVVVLYLVGLVYLSTVWQLASLASVLEDVSGIKALSRSKALIKGKMGIAVAMFVLLGICFVVIQVAYVNLAVPGILGVGVGIRVVVGILCFLFLFNVILIGLVSQTVFYFVCKSHHHENIESTILFSGSS